MRKREIKELQKIAILRTAHLWILLITSGGCGVYDDNHKYMLPLLVFRWVDFSLQEKGFGGRAFAISAEIE
jgi:hypothetical protein